MAITPEKASKMSVVLIFIILVAALGGALSIFTHSIHMSVAAAIIIISSLMVVFYSQQIGIFAIFLFFIVFVVAAIITMKADVSLFAASLAAGAYVVYSIAG